MNDPLLRHSFLVSTVVHALLVATVIAGRSCQPQEQLVEMPAAQPETTEAPAEPPTPVVLAPQQAPPATALPSPPETTELPPLDPIRPVLEEARGSVDSSGADDQGGSSQPLSLPQATHAPAQISDPGAGQRERQEVDTAVKQLQTLAAFLAIRLGDVYEERWQERFDTVISNRRLIARCVLRGGRVHDCTMLKGSGSSQLDARIIAWVRQQAASGTPLGGLPVPDGEQVVVLPLPAP